MDTVRRYCAAQRTLDAFKGEEQSRTADLRQRRAFALETLDKELQKADLDCCEAVVPTGKVYVVAKMSKKSRMPSATEVHALIDKLRGIPDGDAGGFVEEALCGPFQNTVRNGVTVTKKLVEGLEPKPLPPHLVAYVTTVLETAHALANVRKAMNEKRKAARKEIKATRDDAIAALRDGAPVRIDGNDARYHAYCVKKQRVKKATLKDIAAAAHRGVEGGGSLDVLRASLKQAVDDAYEPDDEPSVVEVIRCATE